MNKITIGLLALSVLAGVTAGGPVPAFATSQSGQTDWRANDCVLDVMQKAKNADVVVLHKRETANGLRVRLGVGPDRKPWGCTFFTGGGTGNIGPITNQHENHGHTAAEDHRHKASGLDQQDCINAVLDRVNTADVVVLNSRKTNNGALVRLGVGPDQKPWRCRALGFGETRDVGPVHSNQ